MCRFGTEPTLLPEFPCKSNPLTCAYRVLIYYSLVVCGLYYVGWIYVVPKIRGYRIRQGIITLDSGAKTHKLFKVPIAELAAWDASHDALGRELDDGSSTEQVVQLDEKTVEKA